MNTIIISKHAYQRIKERNGWNKKTADRMIKKIYVDGLRKEQIKGYKKQWFMHKEDSSDKNKEYVVYGDYVYIFSNNVLITTFPMPCRQKILRSAC